MPTRPHIALAYRPPVLLDESGLGARCGSTCRATMSYPQSQNRALGGFTNPHFGQSQSIRTSRSDNVWVGGHGCTFSGFRPVLNGQSRYRKKIAVAADHGAIIQSQRDGGNLYVNLSDGSSGASQRRCQSAILVGCQPVKRPTQDSCQCAMEPFQVLVSRRAVFSAVDQLAQNRQARPDLRSRFTGGAHTIIDAIAMVDEVSHDSRVEKVPLHSKILSIRRILSSEFARSNSFCS